MRRHLSLTAGLGALLIAVAAFAFGIRWSASSRPSLALPLATPAPGPIEAQYALTTTAREIAFGFTGSSPGGDLRAVIRVTEGSVSRDVALPGELDGCTWVHAARSLSSPWIWAVAEFSIEGPGWELPILASDDGGATWFHLATVPKPYYLAEFESLRMRADGTGTLTMFLEDYGQIGDSGGRARDWWEIVRSWRSDEVPPMPQRRGHYVWHTTDHGRTWTGPAIEEDDLESLEARERER